MVLISVILIVSSWFGLALGECHWLNEKGGEDLSPNPIINCHLRILDFRRNSSQLDDLLGLHGSAAETLRIRCSDVFFFESQLRSDHFGTIPDLKHLSIEYCKLRQLPPRSFVGLSGLKWLSVNTFNADWSDLRIEPDYESFVGLDRLEVLDLSHNNLVKLPSGLFCPLSQIKVVNLSNNALEDLNNLGLTETPESKCPIPVQQIVLQHNRIRSIPPNSISGLQHLKHIDLSHNQLGVLLDNTFATLEHLEVVNLSFNRLVSLPPGLFATTHHLRELNLANNSIGTLNIKAFSNLTKLQVLNLSSNSLDENWIKPGIFSVLTNLLFLDLSSNHISRIESKLLSDLTKLQVLNLEHNRIHTISSNAFTSQINLHILSLSHNQLESLPHQTLSGLSVLSSISLDSNRLHSVHEEAFKNCSNLKDISLSKNYLTQVIIKINH